MAAEMIQNLSKFLIHNSAALVEVESPVAVIGSVADRLSTFLIHESAVLSEVESRVEEIRRELMLMQAFLEHIESRGQGEEEGFNKWADDLKDIARSAEDVIGTFVDKSVGRGWIFSLVDRYKIGKELERISQRIRDISQRSTKYDQSHLVEDLPETSASVASPNATVAPAVEKLSCILSENLVAGFEVRIIVEEVRDEVVSMLTVVSNLKSKEQPSEREKVWLEEANAVCNFTVSVIEDFITRRTEWRLGVFMNLPYPLSFHFRALAPETKLVEKMKYIKTQIQGALRRRLTYGVGEEDVGDKIESISMVPLPLSLLQPLIIQKEPISSLVATIQSVVQSIVTMRRSAEKKLESIQRDLALMCAFFRDTTGAEGLNERQKVWVKQIRDVAQQAEALLAAYELRMNQYKGGFRRLFQHVVPPLEFIEGINYILYKMHNIWERKTIYDIANIEGRKDSASSDQSMQGSASEIHIVVENNANSGTEEDPLLPAGSLQGMSNKYRPVKGHTKKVVESIREDMELMYALFDDAKKVGELDGRSKAWVEQMRDIAHEIESVSDEYASELEDKPIHVCIFNYPAQHEIQLKINQIRNKIQEASRIRKKYGVVHLQTRAEPSSVVQRLRGRTQAPLTVKESNIIGFDEDVEVLMEKLLSENRCIISIIGIEGTGKTALAGLICDNATRDHFHYQFWVSARQDSVELRLKDIAKQITEVEEATWTAKEDLTQINKRYLIVVDDIQTSQVWDALEKTIPYMPTGCRFLLTSRNANEELHAGPRTFVHQLRLLDDENSWVLFKRNLKVDIPPELMKVGKEIAIKCWGLPSEILKIGDLLSKKDVSNEGWSSMLEQLNQYQTPWSETLDKIKNLPIYLGKCLFYFVLFPAGFEIPVRRLVVLWVAEEVVRGQDDKPPEQVAESYLTELIDRNMVQIAKRKRNGKVKTCRLPNALRESPFLQRPMSTNSDSVPKKSIIRQVVDQLDKNDICYDHIHSDTINASASLKSFYKDVLSFLSFDAQEGSKPGQDIGQFLNRCISSGCFLLLRVLDLERVYKPQLPENIARLSRLRYLGLRWTYLQSLPSSISRLLKLQTLDLKHTYINILTSSIWKMQLRHLFLSETYRSRFPPQPRGNYLSDLQTLWGLFVDEKTPVKGGLDRLVNIRKLGLACRSMSLHQEEMTSQLDAVADWIMELKYLQSLRLKSRDKDGKPCNLHLKSLANHADLTDIYLLGILSSSSIMSLFPPSLVELTLSHSKLQEEAMKILGDLPNLRSLCLLAGSYIEDTLLCKYGSFPQLYVLKFWKLEQLEEWNIEQEALPRLRQLEIRSCGSLKMLPDGLQHVNTLLELKLTNMPINFNSRLSDANSVDKHKIPRFCNLCIDDSM